MEFIFGYNLNNPYDLPTYLNIRIYIVEMKKSLFTKIVIISKLYFLFYI